jgi:hypothetical protein
MFSGMWICAVWRVLPTFRKIVEPWNTETERHISEHFYRQLQRRQNLKPRPAMQTSLHIHSSKLLTRWSLCSMKALFCPASPLPERAQFCLKIPRLPSLFLLARTVLRRNYNSTGKPTFAVLPSSTCLFTAGVEVVYFHLITLRHTPHSVGLL